MDRCATLICACSPTTSVRLKEMGTEGYIVLDVVRRPRGRAAGNAGLEAIRSARLVVFSPQSSDPGSDAHLSPLSRKRLSVSF
ncbi:hypothetical protein BV22DRAFT_506859 [Leucogyrophana mollusca]|uniref:Uncharacterized protein n=1 Tax=Leucogyrophana mollusca TaxID=85980 RepID=A0ACB8BFL8_9AGAM|nr:hypothetical protein BV22DRAFT_506859 [Leucogyrophana mollusca]